MVITPAFGRAPPQSSYPVPVLVIGVLPTANQWVGVFLFQRSQKVPGRGIIEDQGETHIPQDRLDELTDGGILVDNQKADLLALPD